MMWNPSSAPAKLLPRPKDDEQFEELTAELLGAVYRVELPIRYGRSGQDQYGLDVVLDTKQGKVGIQCKLHTSEKVKDKVLEDQLSKDLDKLKRSQVSVVTFVFATTARRSRGVQDAASELAEDAPFEIRTFFWDDFEEYLPRHRPVYDWYLGLHYPGLEAGRDEPTFEEQLRKWRAHVRRQTRTVDPFVGEEGEGPRLDRVFVRREVGAERGGEPEEDAETGDAVAPHGALDRDLTLRKVLALDPADDPRVTGKWVLLGDPGAGKTTLLRHLAREVMETREPEWVPLRLHLSEVVGCGGWLQTECERAGVGERFFDRVDRDGRLLLLLDGLDELTRDRRVDGREFARAVRETWPRATVVVASRLTPYDPLGEGFVELRVQPLSEETRAGLLAFYLSEWGAGGREEAEEHLKRLKGDPWLRELTSNPLSLTLLALLLRQRITPAGSRAKLYRQIFDLLLAGEHRRPSRPFEPQTACRDFLRQVAHGMAELGEEQLDHRDLVERLSSGELGSVMQVIWQHPSYTEDRDRAHDRFFDGLERTGILVHCAPQQWRFWHRYFREALTAERLAQVVDDDPAQAVALVEELGEKRDQAAWSEALALLPGHLAEGAARDAVVRALFLQNFKLGLRSLGAVDRMGAGIVAQVFRRTEERRLGDLTPQILRLLADDELLAFIEDERETRNPNRLFWLLWLLWQVERRSKSMAEEVKALRGRFFAHIPTPPLDLFTIVETPQDGQVDLWCAVKAGEFRMGSPESEAGGGDNERPQHLVTMKSGYRMAAVPVTRAQYAAFDPDHEAVGFAKLTKEELAHYPVTDVSWYAAMAFCCWLAQALPETAGARLPTEAEWEYACRAGTKTEYWKGSGIKNLRQVSWYSGNSGRRPHRVGELLANHAGLYDVHGNVGEWTLSRWTEDYSHRQSGVEVDPESVTQADEIAEALSGGSRVTRGGSWASIGNGVRSAYRRRLSPGGGFGDLGFRVLLPKSPSIGARA